LGARKKQGPPEKHRQAFFGHEGSSKEKKPVNGKHSQLEGNKKKKHLLYKVGKKGAELWMQYKENLTFTETWGGFGPSSFFT